MYLVRANCRIGEADAHVEILIVGLHLEGAAYTCEIVIRARCRYIHHFTGIKVTLCSVKLPAIKPEILRRKAC